ncbi:AraC family transcriptional regulator [Maricaulis sp.]|uniref:helix-turn-helix domain-containing protein n=1 Tax=Maricaulis sp. TaxID=1486257 RepID=UPI00260209FA|nr:AraC family transcriptional regulator [Maricaulis sp.]
MDQGIFQRIATDGEDYQPPSTSRYLQLRLSDIETENVSHSISLKTIKSGVEHFRIHGRDFVLTPDTVLLVGIDTPFRLSVREGDTVEGVCLQFAPQTLMEQFKIERHALPRDVVFRMPRAAILGGLPDALLDGTVTMTDELFLKLQARTYRTLRRLSMCAKRLSVAGQAKREDIISRLEAARYFLSSKASEAVSVDEAARHCGLSSAQFARYFRDAYQCTPAVYHRAIRLGWLRSVLTVTELTPREAAERGGFTDYPTFSKAFKRAFGCSPSDVVKQRS